MTTTEALDGRGTEEAVAARAKAVGGSGETGAAGRPEPGGAATGTGPVAPP
ncbi:hypothetical protein JNUCC64_30975 [Streptomyces sp. JNUCC 64]